MSQNSSEQLMTIFVRQFTGKSITLQISLDCSMVDFANSSFQAHQNVSFSKHDYWKSIGWMFAGKSLTNFECRLKDYGVGENSTINEIPKGFTMSPNFNWDKLCVEDSLSLDDASNIIFLNPGCLHSFDKRELRKWADSCKNRRRSVSCPLCRMMVDQTHLDRL